MEEITVKQQTETCYFPVDINIKKAGETVKVEKALPLLFDKVEGVTILNPGGVHGGGNLYLSVAGEEIFPETFHARTVMCYQSSHHEEAIVSRALDNYLYPIEEKAKGATVSAKYTEPSNGASGVLYLLFKLTRQIT